MVADTETTAAPGPTPNSSPAVIVSGTAGRASTSNAVYNAPYAGYLQDSQTNPLHCGEADWRAPCQALCTVCAQATTTILYTVCLGLHAADEMQQATLASD